MTRDRLISIVLLATAISAARAQPAPQAPRASAYVQPAIHHEPYGEIRIVVPLTSDEKGVQRMKLANISNGLKAADAWKGKFTVKVVLYGRGILLLQDPDEETRSLIDMLKGRGVQLDVCNNSLAALGIDFHALYRVGEADIVPSGFAEVAYLQARQQYVLDPLN